MRTRARALWLPLVVLWLALAGVVVPHRSLLMAAQPAQTGCAPDTCRVCLPLLTRAPIAPILLEPSPQATIDSVAPVLRWSPAPTGTVYLLDVATSPDFTDIVFDSRRTFDTPTQEEQRTVVRDNLAGATTYYWRVGVQLPEGTNYSPVWSFTTAAFDAARLPAPPAQLAPRNGEQVTTLAPVLSWQAVPGADYYRVKMLNANGSRFRETGPIPATRTTYTASGLAPGTTYLWQVRVHTSYGWSDYGGLWSFRTP